MTQCHMAPQSSQSLHHRHRIDIHRHDERGRKRQGVQCSTDHYLSLRLYVNGGGLRELTFDPGLSDEGSFLHVQFTAIRVAGYRSGGSNYTDHVCTVSWGLN